MSLRKIAPIVFTFCLFVVTAIAQQVPIPKGITKVDSIEGITEYRLENGLQVLLIPDPARQNVLVNIIYRVGSRHEGYGETGMAHLLEHLVFRGTPKHPDIPSELTARGAAPNGTTWFDRTNYYENFVASDANLEWAIDLEADRMINSFISKTDLEKEFSVVRNEMESSENNPSRVLSSKVMAAAYQWHNYGKTTIGARSDVEKVKIENLQAFYRKYYQPDNATLVIGGKFDEAKALELIGKKFGSIPRPSRVLQNTWTEEPVQDGERQVTLRRVGDLPVLIAGYHAPPASHPDYIAFRILLSVLTDSTNGKLYKALVDTKKAVSINTNLFQNKEPSYATFETQLPKSANLEEVRDILVTTLENFASEPVPAAEVERMKTSIIRSREHQANNVELVAMSMTEWVGAGDWRLYFLYRDRVNNVTPADVQRVAKQYLLRSNRTVGMFIPTSDPIRASVPRVEDEEIAEMVKGIDRNDTRSTGEAFDPTPANIIARTKNGKIGGLTTALLAKENRGDAVTLNMQIRFGDEKTLAGRREAAIFAGRLLNRGTRTKTREQLRDEMDRIKARISVFGGPTNAELMIETTRENLAQALRLGAEMLKDPGYPEREFEQAKNDSIARLESQRSEPASLASREMAKIFNARYPKGHPNYPQSIDEEISALRSISLDDVKRFHQDFYGASTGEVAVVGEFDEKEVARILEQEFGNWKSPRPFARIVSGFVDVAPVNKSIETPDKANATFTARMNIRMSDDDPDYPAFELANFILGGGFLNSRLATRIRHKDGLSYGVGSSFRASAFERSGSFFGSAIYAPENVGRLEEAFRDEIERAVRDGFTEDEVAKAKAGYLLDVQRSRGSDSGIARLLTDRLEEGRTFAWDQAFDARIGTLTAQEVNEALRKYLRHDRLTIIKAGDFEKKRGQ